MGTKIGDGFRVLEETEIKDGRDRVLARYLTAHEYRITPRNLDLVLRLIDEGKAVPAGGARPSAANRLSSPRAQLRGAMKTSDQRGEP